MAGENRPRWDGTPGHYEVHYLTLTDRASGCGAWLRYTMLAPLADGGEAVCALWFAAMDPADPTARVACCRRFPLSALSTSADPFTVRIDESELTDTGARGGFDDVSWELTWDGDGHERTHVHPLLERAGLASTILRLPAPDLAIEGSLSWRGRKLTLAGARGGQAHLWGAKHARRWCWMHCSDLETAAGEPRPGDWLDAVSVVLPRLGREVGPSTPVIGSLGGRELEATGPVAVLANPSRLALTAWTFAARDGRRRIEVEVDAPRDQLVGVTYHDPDGEPAYCYHTDVASLRARIWERSGPVGSWALAETLVAAGRAHFEYAQREPVADIELSVQ